jgi:hypothetical protein
MLWDLLVLGLPSEGGLGMKPAAPSSFELMVMAIVWIAGSVKPLWDRYIKNLLDNVGRALLIYQACRWFKNRLVKKKKNR